MKVQVLASFGQGQSLQALSDLVGQRQKWLGETARNSVAATMINILKSVRAATVVAKARPRLKISKDNSLYASVTVQGGRRIPCARYKNGTRYTGNERILLPKYQHFKDFKVFRWTDAYAPKGRSIPFLVFANTEAQARAICMERVKKRMDNYRMLAKKVECVLMNKIATVKTNDQGGRKINRIANKHAAKTESVSENKNGGVYRLTVSDTIDYAILAVKGGKSYLNTAYRKAANAIAAIINRRIAKHEDFFNRRLATPFPEVAHKRNIK